jgi:hypothetical protein
MIRFILLLVLYLAFYGGLWRGAPAQMADTRKYQEVAQDLADGRLDRVHYRTPGYPVLLALTGSAEHPTRALYHAGLLIHFAAVVLLRRELDAVGVGRSLGRTFVAVSLLPPFVEPAAMALAENLTGGVLGVGLACVARWLRGGPTGVLALGAVLLAYSGLTRPTYQVLGVALAGLLGLAAALPALRNRGSGQGRRLAAGAVVLAGVNLAVVGGFVAYNFARFGYLGVTPALGHVLTTKTALRVEDLPGSYGRVRSMLLERRNRDLIQGESHTASQYFFGIMDRVQAETGLEDIAFSRYMLRLNLTLILKRPLAYVHQVGVALVSQTLPSSSRFANFGRGSVQLFWAVLHYALLVAFLAPLTVLVGLGLFTLSGGRLAAPASPPSTAALLIYAAATFTILYSVAITAILDVGKPAQRTPVDVLAVFATVLGVGLWRALTADRARLNPSRAMLD